MSSRKTSATDKGTSRPAHARPLRIAALCCCAAGLFFLGIYTAEFFSRRSHPPALSDPFSLVDDPHATTAPRLPPQAVDPLPGLSFFDTLAGKKPAEDLLIESDQTPHKRRDSLPQMPAERVAAPAGPQPDQPAQSPEAVYTIQLVSYASAQAARDFSVRLAEKGYEPYIQTIDIPGKGKVYRVRMGRFHSLDEAQQMANEFERMEKMSVLITSR